MPVEFIQGVFLSIDDRVLADLYSAHSQDMLRLALLLTKDRGLSEEITHEAFLRFLTLAPRLRSNNAARAYLMRALVNLVHSNFRRRRLERLFLADRKRELQARGEELPNIGEQDDVWRALRRIPIRQRIAVVLRYCEDLSERETAEIMDTSISAVKSLTNRGLRSLRDYVERP